MKDSFGTTTWAERRSGRLSPGETAKELLHGLMALGAAETSRLGRRLGLGRRGFTLALAEVSLPRTALARAAEARLVRAGAGYDVVGDRFLALAPPVRDGA